MPDFLKILNAAHAAAANAVAAKGPENPSIPNCGFAWVTVPGNSPIARWCRKEGKAAPGGAALYGSKGYPNGWEWWCPGGFAGQSVDHHAAGARAFAAELAKHWIVATVSWRYD